MQVQPASDHSPTTSSAGSLYVDPASAAQIRAASQYRHLASLPALPTPSYTFSTTTGPPPGGTLIFVRPPASVGSSGPSSPSRTTSLPAVSGSTPASSGARRALESFLASRHAQQQQPTPALAGKGKRNNSPPAVPPGQREITGFLRPVSTTPPLQAGGNSACHVDLEDGAASTRSNTAARPKSDDEQPQALPQPGPSSTSEPNGAASSSTVQVRPRQHVPARPASIQPVPSTGSTGIERPPSSAWLSPEGRPLLDRIEGAFWVFPVGGGQSERSYQKRISHAALLHNTLVVLPTGLGKTLIAAVVMGNYHRSSRAPVMSDHCLNFVSDEACTSSVLSAAGGTLRARSSSWRLRAHWWHSSSVHVTR